MLNLDNLFVSETCSKSCAIDLWTKFFSFSHWGKKNPKIVSETCAKWLWIGTVSESRDLPFQTGTLKVQISLPEQQPYLVNIFPDQMKSYFYDRRVLLTPSIVTGLEAIELALQLYIKTILCGPTLCLHQIVSFWETCVMQFLLSGISCSVTRKKSPNVYKSCLKMISLE